MSMLLPSSATECKLRVGIVGVGVGAAEILPAIKAFDRIELVAAADTNPRILEVFKQRYGGKTFGSVEELCDDPDVEAVFIATPHRFHAAHTIIILDRGACHA